MTMHTLEQIEKFRMLDRMIYNWFGYQPRTHLRPLDQHMYLERMRVFTLLWVVIGGPHAAFTLGKLLEGVTGDVEEI